MKLDLDQRHVRWALQGGLTSVLQQLLVRGADAIGFCVAEIRIHVFPRVHKIWQYALSQPDDELRHEPSFVTVFRQMRDPDTCCVEGEEIEADATDTDSRGQLSDKKYTYSWAVGRIAELEKIGVSDPINYFNNEMADWWLAPDGMMEAEADFHGIAHAIEERWHV